MKKCEGLFLDETKLGMYMNRYSIENLIKTFIEHAKRADENHKEWVKAFRDNSPNEELPDHLEDDFNLPRAIESMCREILDLKDLHSQRN